MQRIKNLIPLSHDHFHGLKLAQMLKKNAPEFKDLPNSPDEKIRYAEEFYRTDLVMHFRNEEEILYPLIKGKDKELDKMFEELIAEHRMIKVQIEQLSSSSDPVTDMDSLGRLLESHIRREERIVFPRIQQVIPENLLKEMDNKITSVRRDEK